MLVRYWSGGPNESFKPTPHRGVGHVPALRPMIVIREESANDYGHIRTVTFDAFSASEFGHNGESELIDSLRSQCDNTLSLVACSESEVIGHILFTPVVIQTLTHKCVGMGLAPLSVTPNHQHAGVGSLLVNNGLRRLRDERCPFVVVLGHPQYYPRFGFRFASHYQISHGFSGIPQEVFFIQTNAEDTMTKLIGGKAYYHPVFGSQHDGK